MLDIAIDPFSAILPIPKELSGQLGLELQMGFWSNRSHGDPTYVKVHKIHVDNGGVHKKPNQSMPPLVASCLASVGSP